MSRFEEKSVEEVGAWLLQEKFSESVIKSFRGMTKLTDRVHIPAVKYYCNILLHFIK